jgi:ribosome-associated protein
LSHWKFQCTIRTGDSLIREQHTSAVRPIRLPPPNPPWLTAVRAAESKKATDIRVLDLREITSFADFFVICSGSNPKQIQAISEEIGEELGKIGEYPVSVEGFANAEWILADFGDYLVHVFSPKARSFYELERLWRHAKVVEVPPA